MKHLVAPSLLAADFTRLGEEVALVNDSPADWLHFDVMDGRFVPNISFGIPVLRAVRELSEKPIDVHLMIAEPDRYVEAFREAGADNITVHFEACPHLHRTLQHIRQTGARAGVALNPHTPVAMLEEVLEDLDIVLLMSVNPGFGGQQFIYRTIPKIRELVDRLTVRNLSAYIEVDGGLGPQNAEKVLQAGANVLVAGSSIFRTEDPGRAIQRLKGLGHELKYFT